ncbi:MULTISPECIES: quinol dehydrogenase ferredoxin subunit NapH [unclassified Helicobacter]|uniref:quinol dehydrogenase ferredoxin subunit NapH n=1 Tax=unclassified Helicobacter TaxID=2593540 RepID=UPI000CF114E9|nr:MULTISPECIES: quinol dehydrogenase ferredoxin subunit NapH [unclassified Helicobacter]
MWLAKNYYLILRRFTQISLLLLFVLANCSLITISNQQHLVIRGDISKFENGERNLAIANPKKDLMPFSILEGNLSGSKVFDLIPLSDPLAFMQIFLAGGAISIDLLIGFLIILLFYGFFLGRGYCAFVCPINLVTDFANFLRRKFHIENIRFLAISRKTKFAVLFLALLLSLLFGVLAWEMISPISMLHRGIIFGMGSGFFGILVVFLFDLFMLKNGFCGHICPLGATYSLIGAKSFLKIEHKVENCTKCMQCVRICPENQVLNIVGKTSGLITGIACIKCGRCIEVCDDNALSFNILNFIQKEKK